MNSANKKKNIIVYVPALHKGYIEFFKENPGNIFLIDLSLVRNIPRLERDIRAMDTSDVKKSLESIGFSNVDIIDKNNIKKISSLNNIFMPEEDVSKEFAKEFLNNKDVNYVPVFLRWNRHNSLKKDKEVLSDTTITRDKFDKEIINKAYKEAEKSPDWWRQVGAVLMKDKEIVLTGYNKPLPSNDVHNIFGDPRSNFDYGESFELSKFIHAEAKIIAEAANKGTSLNGASIYVTTFPCPVCAKSIALSGIKKVYYKEGYSLLDAEDILKSFDVEIIKVEE
ncbi:MAG: deaminase [Candidatus Paceibacterota bacterium]